MSGLARKAVQCSANLKDLGPFHTHKSYSGIPVPVKGHYWSLTHKPEYVGGVVAEKPVGIDLEHIKPVSMALRAKLASPQEWRLGSTLDPILLFFRYWTAKEAVLKASGVGLKGLGQCRVLDIPSIVQLRLTFCGALWEVSHFFFDNHIVSIVNPGFDIRWVLKSDSDASI